MGDLFADAIGTAGAGGGFAMFAASLIRFSGTTNRSFRPDCDTLVLAFITIIGRGDALKMKFLKRTVEPLLFIAAEKAGFLILEYLTLK